MYIIFSIIEKLTTFFYNLKKTLSCEHNIIYIYIYIYIYTIILLLNLYLI